MHQGDARGRNRCAYYIARREYRMGVLNTNDLKVGMILAEPALNKNGTVILGEGSALTEKHINLFKAWGVSEVDVEGVDSGQMEKEEMQALSPEVVDAIQRKLDILFPACGKNPVMEEIYRVVKKISLRDAMGGTESRTDGSPNH